MKAENLTGKENEYDFACSVDIAGENWIYTKKMWEVWIMSVDQH